MTRFENYKGYKLIVIEQPGGGYQVEITRIPRGKPVLTMKFLGLADAVDEAHRIVDHDVID